MRYLNRRSNGSYRYFRKYPLGLRSTFANLPVQYSRELPEINDTSSDEDKFKALMNASKHYELHLKTLRASDPQAFSDSERAMAIDEVLRRKKLKAGEFVGDKHGHVDSAFDELWNMPSDADRENTGKPYTFKESVMIDAYFAAQVLPEVKLEQTFRQAWANYLKRELITDVTTGNGRDKQNRFERVFAITGDFVIGDETKRDVLTRLQKYIDVRADDGIKAQTIKRGLKEVIAAIRGVPQLAWADAITLNPKRNSLMVPKDTREIKGRVLRQDELDLLITKALNQPDEYLICFLLQLHAGLGPMEIKRLRLDKDVFLDAPVPHILFRGGDEGQTKKEARVRVVPIVLGLSQIKQWLPELHRWLNNITDKSPPATLNRKLRKLLDDNSPDVKGHSFRHTWVRLANRAEISVRHEHAIGGWNKRNDTELNRVLAVVYDPNGFVEDNVLLEKVQSAQQAVFARWLDEPSTASMNNVLPFSGDKSK